MVSVYFIGELETGRALAGPCRDVRLRLRTFESITEFIAIAPALEPGCLVVDADRLELPTDAILERLAPLGVAFPVIFIGARSLAPVPSGVSLTVVGYAEKPVVAHTFAEYLRKARDLLRTPEVGDLDIDAISRIQSLPKQERDILTYIVAGMTNKAIAASLRIDIRAVELSRVRLMRALDVSTLSGLVRVALAGGVKLYRD